MLCGLHIILPPLEHFHHYSPFHFLYDAMGKVFLSVFYTHTQTQHTKACHPETGYLAPVCLSGTDDNKILNFQSLNPEFFPIYPMWYKSVAGWVFWKADSETIKCAAYLLGELTPVKGKETGFQREMSLASPQGTQEIKKPTFLGNGRTFVSQPQSAIGCGPLGRWGMWTGREVGWGDCLQLLPSWNGWGSPLKAVCWQHSPVAWAPWLPWRWNWRANSSFFTDLTDDHLIQSTFLWSS